MHVPRLQQNILSISQFTTDFDCVSFWLKGLTATDRHTGRVNLSGKRSKDIYTADVCKQSGFFSIRERKTSSFFWPCHLGHCSFDAGDFLKKKGDIEVVADCFSPTICYSYQLAKSTKLSFSKSFHRAVSPFSKISCDLWGPAPVVSNEGYKHYVLFVDDHTRFLWFYPICSKSYFFTVYVHLKS